MAVSREFTSLHEALEVVGAEGFEGIGKALQILMNTAMHLERQKYLNASDYERTEGRRGYANGYKPKTVKTRVGEIELRVRQTRDSGFFPSCLTKGAQKRARRHHRPCRDVCAGRGDTQGQRDRGRNVRL